LFAVFLGRWLAGRVCESWVDVLEYMAFWDRRGQYYSTILNIRNNMHLTPANKARVFHTEHGSP